MTRTAPTVVGPPPPLDRECEAVLASLPPFPPLTFESIPAMRAGAAEYTPRPTNDQLARGGAYLVEEFAVPGPVGAPDVALLVCRPAAAAAAAPAPALYYTHGGGMIAGTNRDSIVEILDLAEQVGAAVGRSSTGSPRRRRTPARSRTATQASSGRPRTPGSSGSTATGSS